MLCSTTVQRHGLPTVWRRKLAQPHFRVKSKFSRPLSHSFPFLCWFICSFVHWFNRSISNTIRLAHSCPLLPALDYAPCFSQPLRTLSQADFSTLRLYFTHAHPRSFSTTLQPSLAHSQTLSYTLRRSLSGPASGTYTPRAESLGCLRPLLSLLVSGLRPLVRC